MASQKRRLKKGIDSLSLRIREHLEKLKKAEESDDPGLIEYYKKEIENLKKAQKRKEKLLKK